jgi:hypothetical protein
MIAAPLDLREAWADLRERRAALGASLWIYGEIVDAWARWTAPGQLPSTLDAAACHAAWTAGSPLVDEASRRVRPGDIEGLLGDAMEALARLDPALGPPLQRLASAWDEGAVTPAALLRARGSPAPGSSARVDGLAEDAWAFLAVAALRPALGVLFAPLAEHLSDAVWSMGTCPLCGGPPGFTDVVEDGRRRLACIRCGGAWLFPKLRCPFCGVEGAQHLVRLMPGEAREEGYTISACRRCRAYVKEIDRRVRWNGGPPLVEDWGSPHFDLIARRQGYWRPDPPVVLRASGPGGEVG